MTKQFIEKSCASSNVANNFKEERNIIINTSIADDMWL